MKKNNKKMNFLKPLISLRFDGFCLIYKECMGRFLNDFTI